MFIQTDPIASLWWTKGVRKKVQEEGGLHEVYPPWRWESLWTAGGGLSGSDWHSLEERMYIPYHKDCTETSAEQHHDFSWLIRCGARWGTMTYICAQRFLPTQTTKIQCSQDWNAEPDSSEGVTSFWILIFEVCLFLIHIYGWILMWKLSGNA